jgi:hypothetical protein
VFDLIGAWLGSSEPRLVTAHRTAALVGAATEAEGAVQNTFGQIKDAARDAVDTASSAAGSAYGAGAEIVAERPGSALLLAGLIGFALGVVLTKGSQPPRRSRWQRIHDFE